MIEGQIKELQGVVPDTPPLAENDQKSPGRIGLRNSIFKCKLYLIPGYIDFRVGDDDSDESKASEDVIPVASRTMAAERSHLLVWQVSQK